MRKERRRPFEREETVLEIPGEGECVAIGKVVKTKGLRGEIKVVPYNPESSVLARVEDLFLMLENGKMERSSIQTVKGGRGSFFLSLQGCESIEHAKQFVGAIVYVRRSELPTLSEEEFYCFEIIGLEVFGEQGRFYGTIQEIIQTGSNDVYVVRHEEKEYLVPATEKVIVSIDIQAKKVIIHPIPGLFDDD